MVNGPLPHDPYRIRHARRYLQTSRRTKAHAGGENSAKARPGMRSLQILGKFYFFKLRENLRRILLDYGQKRSGTANAAFKAAC